MFDIFITSLKYSFAERANKTLYNLNKIPFLKKVIGDRFYKETTGKNVFGIIGLIFSIIGKFLGSLIMLFVGVVLPAKCINEYMGYGPIEVMQLQIIFVISLFASFLKSSIFSNNKNDYNMIKLMRVNPKEYYLTKLITGIPSDFIDFILLYIFGIYNPIFLTLEFMALEFIGEYVQIFLFDKFDFMLCKKKVLKAVLWILIILAGYVPCIFGLLYDFRTIVSSKVFLIAVIALGIICFIKIRRYNRYKDIVINLDFKLINQNLDEFNKEVYFGDVQIDKLEEKFLDSSKFNDKTGYEYLNSIFFFRNNKLVRNSVMIKCAVITIAMVILYIVALISKEDVEEIFNLVKNASPYLLFFMYFMSSTERLCKAMFYNCDLSLLRYGFYKRKEDILKNFTSRLKKILFYNSIHTFLLVIEISLFVIMIGKAPQFVEVVPVLISAISLSCFFTVYGVFMYYIIQPYTKNLEIKSPVFTFCNCFIGGVSYGCFKIKTASYIFTLGTIGVTLIFVLISILCIYKYASRTFKLK